MLGQPCDHGLRQREKRGEKIHGAEDDLVGCADPDDLLDNWKWLVSPIVSAVCLLMLMPDLLVSWSPVLSVSVSGSLKIKVAALKRINRQQWFT